MVTDGMEEIRDSILTEEAYRVFAPCMYRPTWERFRERAEAWMRDDSARLLGTVEQGRLVGICVARLTEARAAVIEGIAVDAARRGQGIGKRLIRELCKRFDLTVLAAETDDDAVAFYRRCGFETAAMTARYGDSECVRYRCILRHEKTGQ